MTTIKQIINWKPSKTIAKRVGIALNLTALIFFIVSGSWFGHASYNGLPTESGEPLPNKGYWIGGLLTGILLTSAYWMIFLWLYEPCSKLFRKWLGKKSLPNKDTSLENKTGDCGKE